MIYTSHKIGTVTLKNRWIMLAMHTGFRVGNALEEREFAFYEARAKGGAAAVTLVLGVNETGSLKGMHSGDSLTIENLKTLADRLHSYDCKLIVQLFHCGRNESNENHGEKQMLAPSSVASPLFRAEPKEMSVEDLQITSNDYVKTALLCKEAGADVLEISASAGYLLSEFLSPFSNLREDKYGICQNGGTTYPIEVMEAVREAVGDMPVLLKVSGAQMVEDGYTLEDTVDFCQKAASLIDGITVTGGWHESPVEQISYHVPKGTFASFAEEIKKQTNLPVIACNRIQDGEIGETLLMQGACDFLGTARAFLSDPNFANRVGEKKLFLPCQGCNRCITGILKGEVLSCAFNPEAGQEAEENQRRRIATRKEVVVVGSGPAGMEAAKKAAERGFLTTMITKDEVFGGQLRLASYPPKKQMLMEYISYMKYCLEELGVKILCKQTCDMAFLLEKKPYFTVFAMGSEPLAPEIEGVTLGSFAVDVLNDSTILPPQSEEGQLVVIGGGSVGLETAAYLKAEDTARRITIIEISNRFGKDLGALARPLIKELKAQGVQFLSETKVDYIEPGRVRITGGDGVFSIPTDGAIFATGASSVSAGEMALALMDERLSYAVIGDEADVGNAGQAIHSAYELFTRLYLA